MAVTFPFKGAGLRHMQWCRDSEPGLLPSTSPIIYYYCDCLGISWNMASHYAHDWMTYNPLLSVETKEKIDLESLCATMVGTIISSMTQLQLYESKMSLKSSNIPPFSMWCPCLRATLHSLASETLCQRSLWLIAFTEGEPVQYLLEDAR